MMYSFSVGVLLLVSLFAREIHAHLLHTNGVVFARASPPSCSYVPANPVPKGLICGKNGAFRHPSMSSSTNTDMTSCVNNCLKANRATCVSFSYGPGDKCTLYNKPILGAGQGFIPSSTSQQTFWNRRCWVQSCTCPATSTKCSGSCVDTLSDPQNCGGCNMPISDTDNACCSGKSTDTETDPNNCGACGQSLGDTGNNACCAGLGADTQTDTSNCGTCGKAIGQNDNACCSGVGTDTQTDSSNCGSCGTAIDANDDACCAGESTNTQTDSNNCGACGAQIGNANNACCAGSGVNTQTDSNNCGACGAVISATDNACCAGNGVDTMTDKNNCGSCGAACQGTDICVGGTCGPSCSLQQSPSPVQLLVNGNFDTGMLSSSQDPPWVISTENGDFFNGGSLTQSPPVLARLSPNANSETGSVYQDVNNLFPGQVYSLSTFFKPHTLNPQPSDSSASQSCTMSIKLGNAVLFTRRYSQNNGTQSGYSFVGFNGLPYESVATAPATTARLSLSYSCPAGYIGTGVATLFYDSISLTTKQILVCQ